MNYEPPVIHQLPDWLANQICIQGLKNTNAALTAEVAATVGDATNNAVLKSYLRKVGVALGSGASASITITFVCQSFMSDWSYQRSNIDWVANVHASNP